MGTTPNISLKDLLNNVQRQLPTLADLFELTMPSAHDNEALIIQAQQLLFQQTLALNARLDAQQEELECLRQRQTELEERSRRDTLTGLANRAWLEEQLNRRFELCREQDRTMSVVFIDLDHFKNSTTALVIKPATAYWSALAKCWARWSAKAI